MLSTNKPLPRMTMGLLFAATAALGATACTASGTREIEIGAVSSAVTAPDAPADLVLASDDGTSYGVTRIAAHIRDIRLHLSDGAKCSDYAAQLSGGAACESAHDSTDDSPHTAEDDDDDQIRIAGPFVVDLLNRTATPDLSSVQVPDLPYRRIEFRVDDAESLVPESDPLHGNSWVIEASAGDGSPDLVIALRFNEDIRIEAPGGVSFGDGSKLLVEFDVAGWLQGVPLSSCLQSGEVDMSASTVVLDDDLGGACGEIEDAFKDNIHESGDLLDDDGTHDVGDDHGGATEPGDDKGGATEPGDDKGGA